MSNRRDFLRTGAALAGAAGALGLFPAAIRRALAIEPDRRSGTLRDVEHIVVLMQENRSFDHYFGGLPACAASATASPFRFPPAPNTNAAASGRSTTTALTAARAPCCRSAWTRARPSRPCASPARRTPGPTPSRPGTTAAWASGRRPRKSLDGVLRRGGPALPVRWRAPSPSATPTIARSPAAPTSTGCSCGPAPTTAPDAAMAPPWATPTQAHRRRPCGRLHLTTYPERLERAGIRWRIYQDMADNYALNPTAGFKAYRDAYQGLPGSLAALREKALSTHGLDRLRQDALDGTLPQVSWICPTKAGSEHPSPSSPAQGADYVARVLDALTANPQVWSRTVLLLMFDENDGFFDHMPPPAPPSRDARGALAGASTGHARRIPRDHRGRGIRRYARASARRLWPGTARAHVRAVAPGARRLGQLAGLRPHLGAALHRATLRRGRTQHLALAPRRLRRPDLAVRLQRERARRSRNNPAGNRRAARAAALPGTATPTAPDQPPPARQQPGLRPRAPCPMRCTRMRQRAATR